MAPLPKLSRSEIESLAKKYSGRRQWLVNHGQSWRQARALGLDFYEQCCSHMAPQPNPFRKGIYTVYAIEFSDHSVYVGLTHKGVKRLAEHEVDPRSAVHQKIQLRLAYTWRELKTDVTGVSLAGAFEVRWIVHYRDMGWTVLNKTRGGEPGAYSIRVTNEEIMADAKLFSTRTRWAQKSKHPHWRALAVQRGIYDECCAHMSKRWSVRRNKYDFSEEAAMNNAAQFINLKSWISTKYAYALRRWHPATYAKVRATLV